MPTPCDSADDSDSISPSYTRISVSRSCTTTASTCSPSPASPTTRSPMARRASSSIIDAPSGRGAADGEAGDPQRRDAVAHRDALPVLAAGAGRTHGEVVAQGVDAGEDLGPVADEVALADGIGDL